MLNTATIMGKLHWNWLELNLLREKHSITRDYSAKLQTTKKLSQLQNSQLNLLTVAFVAILESTDINLRWLIVDESVKKVKDGRLRLPFRSEIWVQQRKNPAHGSYREKTGLVTSVWLANQIRGFRIPARSDAWEKNKFELSTRNQG